MISNPHKLPTFLTANNITHSSIIFSQMLQCMFRQNPYWSPWEFCLSKACGIRSFDIRIYIEPGEKNTLLIFKQRTVRQQRGQTTLIPSVSEVRANSQASGSKSVSPSPTVSFCLLFLLFQFFFFLPFTFLFLPQPFSHSLTSPLLTPTHYWFPSQGASPAVSTFPLSQELSILPKNSSLLLQFVKQQRKKSIPSYRSSYKLIWQCQHCNKHNQANLKL